MPTTSPRRLISGPPELPGLMATSVWISGSSSPVSRDLALTMPAVTVLSRPNGEPMAITHSPTLSLDDVADPHRRQAAGVDPHQRDVGALVGADDLGLELALVGQGDDHLLRALDDVGVGQHVAVGVEDEAGAHAPRLGIAVGLLRRARAGPARRRYAEAAEELQHVLVHLGAARAAAGARPLGGADVHHRRPDLVDQVGEVGQGLGARRLRRGRRDQAERERHGAEAVASGGGDAAR